MPARGELESNQPDGNPESQTIDIRQRREGEEIEAAEVPIYSRMWAELVRPLSYCIFALLTAVILIPMLFVFIEDEDTRRTAYDWSKTILAPVVGFFSAAVGYYYGVRQASPNASESAEN